MKNPENQISGLFIPRSFRLVVLLVAAFCCCGYFFPKKAEEGRNVDAFYIEKLENLRQKIVEIQQLQVRNASQQQLQGAFRKARIAYKELAVLSDYFNSYETKLLNGPPLPRVEEDAPDRILLPHGFGVIEEVLFDGAFTESGILKKELQFTDSILVSMGEEVDRRLKFSDPQVWEALAAAVIRITTLGITGFDSPLAKHSIPEARASLESVREISLLYRNTLKGPALFDSINLAADRSLAILSKTNHFDNLDRAKLIREGLNELLRAVQNIRRTNKLFVQQRHPLLTSMQTLFDTAVFDIRFFSPGENYLPTSDRIALGKRLFYDGILSGNGQQSCATCHQPALAFSDGRTTALGFDGSASLQRNTPTLLNAAFQTRQFYDSKALTLETQLSDVVHNTTEMEGSLEESIPVLQQHPHYAAAFKRAYPKLKDPVSTYTIANAIASYVRSLSSLNSRFDRYMRGEEGLLRKEEIEGFNLFAGKGGCASCHFIPLFNGLVPPQFSETESEVLGIPLRSNSKRLDTTDKGKGGFTGVSLHQYAFKTPTVRNSALTAPYMHNGALATLEDVMKFYNSGGIVDENTLSNKTLPSEPLRLSGKEMKKIIAFLQSLNDPKQ